MPLVIFEVGFSFFLIYQLVNMFNSFRDALNPFELLVRTMYDVGRVPIIVQVHSTTYFFLFVRSHCLLFRSISMSTSSREYASMWEQTLSNHTHNQYYLWDRMKSRLHCGRKKNQTRAISGRTAHICRQKMEKKARENMFIQHNITHIFYVLYIISL